MKIRLEMNWFQVLFWKCGPWKGHHEILEAQVWEFEYELDYKKRKGAIWVLSYSLNCEQVKC